MTSVEPYLGNDQLYIGDVKGFVISNTAHIILHTPKHIFILSDILHVPQIKKKKKKKLLLFVHHENCVFFEIHFSVFYVNDLMTKKVLLSG